MILVYLYLEKLISKLVFKNDVFAKINLINSQISFHLSFLYECLITMFIVILFSLI